MNKRFLALAAAVLLAGPASADSLLPDASTNLYLPPSLRVGDLVTVSIIDHVSTTETVTVKRDVSDNANGPQGTGLLGLIPSLGVSNKNSSNRAEAAQTSSDFQNTVTTRVVGVEGNTLLLEGHSKVELDGKLREVVLKGRVRRADVSQANVVSSDKLADAEVTVEGAQSSPGGGGFLDWILFPFR